MKQEFKLIICDTEKLRMATKPANAVQKQLMSDIAEWASNDGMDLLYPCDCPKGFQLHHVLGRSAKHNKTPIGHEFIIPVPYQYHDIKETNNLNVSYFKHNFTKKFGSQVSLYRIMISDMKMCHYAVPSIDKYNAIMSTGA